MTTHVPEIKFPLRLYCSKQNVSLPTVVRNVVGVLCERRRGAKQRTANAARRSGRMMEPCFEGRDRESTKPTLRAVSRRGCGDGSPLQFAYEIKGVRLVSAPF